jgi:hypothetical protein
MKMITPQHVLDRLVLAHARLLFKVCCCSSRLHDHKATNANWLVIEAQITRTAYEWLVVF